MAGNNLDSGATALILRSSVFLALSRLIALALKVPGDYNSFYSYFWFPAKPLVRIISFEIGAFFALS